MSESSLGQALGQAIRAQSDDIFRAADAGEPPITILISSFDLIIYEAGYWRMAERMIEEWLGSDYERAGRKPVPIRVQSRGRCFSRVETLHTVRRNDPERAKL